MAEQTERDSGQRSKEAGPAFELGCTQCGYRLQVQSTQHLPPCPSCHNGLWETITGGDSVNDPYPDR